MGINKFNCEGYYDPTAYEALSRIENEARKFRSFRPVVYKEYRYSPNYFEIEAEQSGTWYQLEQLDDPSKSNEKDCFIKPNERLTLEIDVKSFYGELPAGHYRLIKQFAFFESERDWDYDTYNLSCEFTIR